MSEGGLTGQYLIKGSSDDFDTVWVDGPPTYIVGQNALGGIVFWVDSTGAHGLISAAADNDFERWGGDLRCGVEADGIGAGAANTSLIVSGYFAAGDTANTAGRVCNEYQVQEDGVTPCAVPGVAGATCYGDWYLPSAFELNQMYLQRDKIGGFGTGLYWSSTEHETDPLGSAYSLFFNTGQLLLDTKTFIRNVRCIRKF